MAGSLNTAIRNGIAQLIITQAGANAKIKYYNGARPASGAAVTSQVLLATLISGAVLGIASGGAIDFDEASFTQNNANHVAGTPTWFRITKSDDSWVGDFSISADGTFAGTVANGVDVTLAASTITVGFA